MAILITGGTGNVGLPLLETLSGRTDIRVLCRTEDDAELVRQIDVMPVLGSLAEPASLESAFQGVDRLFLLSPFTQNQEELEVNALTAAEKAGVDHVVKLAYAGLDWPIRITAAHRSIVAWLHGAPFSTTLLLADVFATNILGQADLLRAGQFVLPGADAKIAYVDPLDVGQVGAALVTATTPPGGRVVVTGPATLSNQEVADAAGRAFAGGPATYVPVDAEPFISSLIGNGWPYFSAHAVAEMHETIAARGPLPVSVATETWLQREPTSLEAFFARVVNP